jgi:hypothetical protein
MYTYSDNLTWELVYQIGPFVLEMVLCAVWSVVLTVYAARGVGRTLWPERVAQ